MIKPVTDFIIWLFFVGTVILTLLLLAFGTYYIIQEPAIKNLTLYGAAVVTLAMHYAVRQMPAQ